MVNRTTPRGMKCKKSKIRENSNINAHFLKYLKVSSMNMYICECNNLIVTICQKCSGHEIAKAKSVAKCTRKVNHWTYKN
jgi:hypothetical protein